MVKIKFVLLFCLLFMGIFSSLFAVLIPNVKAVHADQEFTFESEEFFNYPNVPPWYPGVGGIKTYNTRLPTNITQHYNATYSFENDTIGSEPYNWISDNDLGSTSNITESIEAHDNVLWLYDGSIADNNGAFIRQDFSFDVENGIIEFWFMVTDSTKKIDIVGIDVGNDFSIHMYTTGSILYATGGGTTVIINPLVNNQWYHLSLDFNVSTDTYDIYVNGILEVDDKPFATNVDSINNIAFRTDYFSGTNDDYSLYIDAIGYSWDGYNATYTFTNEVDGTQGTSINWINVVNSNDDIEIINSIDNHYKVLRAYQNSGNGWGIHLFNQDIVNETIECFIQVSDITALNSFFILRENNLDRLMLRITNSKFQHRKIDVGWTDVGLSAVNDIWYHIKVSWYDDDTYDLWIDEIQYLDKMDSWTIMVDGYDSQQIMQEQVGLKYIYIDAIGYSWDEFYEVGDNLKHYSIGDNIVPYLLTETSDAILYEVDKNEFYYYDYTNPNFDIYVNGDDNPSGWTDIENGQDNTNIYEKSASDNVVKMVGDGVTAEGTGLYQDFNQDYGNVNVTWDIDIIDDDNNFGIFQCNIHSSDGSLVVSIALLTHSVLGVILSYFDGSIYNTLQNGLGLANFTFKVFIDYSSDTFIFNWYEESSFIDTYWLPLNINGKNGLGIVNYTMDVTASPPNNFEVDLDKVGVYINGMSLVQDFAFVNFWNIVSFENGWQHFTDEYTFIEILSESDDLGYAFFTSFVPYAPDDFPSIFERESFIYNITKGRQLQDFEFLPGEKYIYGPGIRAFFTGRTEILNITYRTAIMIDDISYFGDPTYKYKLEFDTSMDYTSYFYVSDSGSLHFNHYVKDDSLEFIQATFDIVNTGMLNHSLLHDIFKSGLSEAFLRLNYSDDTSTIIDFENYPVHGNLVLPDKVLNQFIVLVSDNDLYDNVNTSGRVDTLILQYIPDWTINIVSVDLITALIPLMIIIIVSVVFGQVLGKESIVPLMLIMSVLCFIVEILPFWLLFISITVFAGIIFSDKDEVS